MVPKYPAARARINRNGSDSSGSEISCDTGPDVLGMSLFIPCRPSEERGDNFIGSSYTSYSPFTALCLLIAIMQSQELDFLQINDCIV